MAAVYQYDWEDPRLATEGFVTDYIVWRMARDGLEWREAPDVPEGAESEHTAMRTMCEIFESRNQSELIELNGELGSSQLHFKRYCEVVDQFGKSETDMPSEMTFGRMVGLIAFAGLICVEKAKELNRRDIGLIALYTSKYIDAGIRLTWIDSARNWARFMDMASQVVARHARASLQPQVNRPAPPAAPLPTPPPPPTSTFSRRSSILMAATVGVVGAYMVGRQLMKSH